MSEKKYSIQEIVYYLRGCKIMRDIGNGKFLDNLTENISLKKAIKEIEDPEDGIEVVIKRKEFLDKENDERTNWN